LIGEVEGGDTSLASKLHGADYANTLKSAPQPPKYDPSQDLARQDTKREKVEAGEHSFAGSSTGSTNTGTWSEYEKDLFQA
jgi:hypothetical protein